MTCLEAQSNILSFVEKKLPEDKKIEFVKHIKHCSNCKEELEIYYTLVVGMKKLDNNEDVSLDFKNKLDEILTKIENKAKKTTRAKISSFSIVFTALVALMFFFYGKCLTKVYDTEQIILKQRQGDTYFYDSFGYGLRTPAYDVIKEKNEKEELPSMSFYDKIHIYNVVSALEFDLDDGGFR